MEKNSTAIPTPKDPNDTSSTLAIAEPMPVFEPYFNREVRRYAKKHKITLEEAFNKITKGRKR